MRLDDDPSTPRLMMAAVETTADVVAQEARESADRTKNEFIAVLSHELRNPLAPMASALAVLTMTRPGSEPHERASESLRRQIRHLTRLVDDLLDITRLDRGKLRLQRTRVDLAELVRRLTQDHAGEFEARGVHLAIDVPMRSLDAHADGTRVEQIVGNLLVNAAKFTPRGGHVEVSLASEGGRARLQVRDDGLGIPATVLARLFRPFSQAEHGRRPGVGGLGLGLALVRGLAELHGGVATATSEGPGRGSTFTVDLPLGAPGRIEPLTPGPSGGPRLRVLVVDDDVDAAEMLKALLELFGHEVEAAFTGADALAAVRARGHDLVLCDIGLPGQDGHEVARAVRADPSTEGTMLVALTGFALPEDRQRALDAGFDVYVTKPVEPKRLRQILADARPRARAPPGPPTASQRPG